MSLVLCANHSSSIIPDAAVLEFQQIYQNVFGVVIPFDEAQLLSTALIDLYQFTTEEGA